MPRRDFLRVGIGGAAAAFLGPLLSPRCLQARSLSLPHSYLQSAVHGYWMKLTYNHRQESRETRRRLGMALRNLGAVRGQGLGFSFVSCFDQAVEQAFRRAQATGQKPGSLFQLIQMLYDDYLFPKTGVLGGQILFEMLFSLLRGRDGTDGGEKVYQTYLNYRAAALAHKNVYKTTQDSVVIMEARQTRTAWLLAWRKDLKALADLYATRGAVLSPNFRVQPGMLTGLEAAFVPVGRAVPHLGLSRVGGNLVVAWKGGATLQQAPSLMGPWTDTRKSSPATFDFRQAHQFFRTIQPEAMPLLSQ